MIWSQYLQISRSNSIIFQQRIPTSTTKTSLLLKTHVDFQSKRIEMHFQLHN